MPGFPGPQEVASDPVEKGRIAPSFVLDQISLGKTETQGTGFRGFHVFRHPIQIAAVRKLKLGRLWVSW